MDKESRREYPPVACDPSTLSPDQVKRKQALQQRLRLEALEILELPDGYAFRHSSTPDAVLVAAEFMTLERICCPFFDFEMRLEHGGGPLWLRITGGQSAKLVIEAELASSSGT